MSKLTKTLVPGYGANPTKPTSNPLSGLAPDLETGLPKGLPSGVGKAALKFSNPVGGISPDINGDIGYQKGWLDNSSNGTPDTGPKPPGYNVWADPDMTKRGWGWGMGADGALHTGVMGGGPAGSPFGPQGATPGANATPSALGNGGQQLAAQLRAGQGSGMPPGQLGPQGPAMPAGGPQGAPPMGGQPQAGMPPPTGGMGPAGMGQQNPQAIQALIAQMRMQQQGQAQPGQLAQ